MLLTVKKQVEETVDVKCPAYYKDRLGQFHYLNEEGNLITVRRNMINMWEREDSTVYTEEIEKVSRLGALISKEEFHKAYAEVSAKLEIAAGAVEF